MDIEKVVQDLNRRFAEPLPEFYRRRIIVWYDEEGEFKEQIAEIELDNAKVVALTGANFFEARKRISVDDTRSNILLYSPLSYNRPDDDWMLDIELYSEEFRADLIAIWMDEMGIDSTPAMRQVVKKYKKFFSAKPRREKVTRLNRDVYSVASLTVAIMSVVTSSQAMNPAGIIRSVLADGLNMDENKKYAELKNYELDEAFWNMVYQGTNYTSEGEKTLKDLFCHMMVSAVSCTYRSELPKEWEKLGDDREKAYCYDLLMDWIHSPEVDKYRQYALEIEDELNSIEFFMRRPIEDMLAINCFPRINQVILSKLMTSINNDIIDVNKIRNVVEKRRVCAFYGEYESIFEGLRQFANMQEFKQKHNGGFHLTSSKEIWAAYTEDYYQMDQYYRLLRKSYEHYLLKFDEALNDLYGNVVERAENLYNNWFLNELGRNWTDISCDEYAKNGRVYDIPHQEYFYKNFVAREENRVCVIISDAMRYEVAAELYEKLSIKQQSKVKISSQQAIFPTITKCGMAALLPHKELEFVSNNGDVKILADQMSTDSFNRETVLTNANPDSVVLKYSDIISMKSSDRSELVKGKKVVFIYHDTIDEVSHKSDAEVFDACSKSIDQISNLVDIMVKDFKALNILITSDHGFLYTHSELPESSKLEKSDFKSDVVEIGRRYVFMKKGSNPDYLMPVRLSGESDDLVAFAPKENIRIKSGGGMKFVHGGTSLQEVVVPVIEYRYVNTGTKEYQKNKDSYDSKPVSLALLSSNNIISNRSFNLDFYQNEPVSAIRSASEYQIYMIDDMGNMVSDFTRVIADKTGENGQDRVFTVNLTLKSLEFSRLKSYYLVIADEVGIEVSRKEFEIAVASDGRNQSSGSSGDIDYFS